MGNLLDNMTRSEREHAMSGKSNPLLNISSDDHSSLYIMLSSGRLLDQSQYDTPRIVTSDIKPNIRLLNQLSSSFKDLDIDHVRESICGKPRLVPCLYWNLPYGHKLNGWRAILYSTPEFGLSYIKVTVLSKDSDTQLSYSFKANSPLQIIAKLREFELLSLNKWKIEEKKAAS